MSVEIYSNDDENELMVELSVDSDNKGYVITDIQVRIPAIDVWISYSSIAPGYSYDRIEKLAEKIADQYLLQSGGK